MPNNPTGATELDINAITQTASIRTIKTSDAMGVASSDTAQTFGTLQSFSAGISAAGGVTFSGNISAPNIVNSWNGSIGAITFANYVASFNGRTGALQGVSAAVAGTGISVSGATGSVTFTNTGVQSFNGLTGAVTGVSLVNGFAGGITFAAGTGITFTASAGTITLSTTGRTIVTTGVSASVGSAAATDYVYIGTTSGNINITLPTAVSNTNRYSIKQSSIGTITVLTTSSQTMDGVTAYNLTKQYQAVDFISDNANWHIL